MNELVEERLSATNGTKWQYKEGVGLDRTRAWLARCKIEDWFGHRSGTQELTEFPKVISREIFRV